MQPVTNWQPLVAWTDTQRAGAASMLALAWRAWMQSWFDADDSGAPATLCVDAEEVTDEGWELLGRTADRCAWIRGVDRAVLEQRLFGEPGATKSRIVADVARRAHAALRTELSRAAAVASEESDGVPAPAALFVRWSGAAVVRLGGPLEIEVLLDYGCMRELVGTHSTRRDVAATAALASIVDAMAEHKLTLSIELSGCELTLGELSQLRIGDAITLPHGLDEPLHARAAGQSLCAAYLGRSHDHKAIELARNPTAR
jgi:hypothetical protein